MHYIVCIHYYRLLRNIGRDFVVLPYVALVASKLRSLSGKNSFWEKWKCVSTNKVFLTNKDWKTWLRKCFAVHEKVWEDLFIFCSGGLPGGWKYVTIKTRILMRNVQSWNIANVEFYPKVHSNISMKTNYWSESIVKMLTLLKWMKSHMNYPNIECESNISISKRVLFPFLPTISLWIWTSITSAFMNQVRAEEGGKFKSAKKSTITLFWFFFMLQKCIHLKSFLWQHKAQSIFVPKNDSW